MIVSWDWLKEYLSLPQSVDEVTERLSMAGLNHESTVSKGADIAVDLEVTSNRPDCLGHLGVAREIAVLYGQQLNIPGADPAADGPSIKSLTRVTIADESICPRYTARVIQGVRVGPSPDWLADRLETIGIAVINNIVDISNYVMFECGQPLHAFDFRKLAGPEIVVRPARKGEKLIAIDHRTYELDETMCVIADAERPVALGGVMGGAETEVSEATVDLLIESAEFDPISIRNTARKLNLHSPSSYRFERSIDPAGVDWASRRCCELILELAGGSLAQGVLDVGRPVPAARRIVLRLAQVERILGISIPPDRIAEILDTLGGHDVEASADQITVSAPSWRRDWEREIDLIEEVARIHGYEQIPEDVRVPMAVSQPRVIDEVLPRLRQGLTAMGFDEALTASVVPADWAAAFDGWSSAEPLRTASPLLRGADRLRLSLLPSLLDARRYNESLGNFDAELFETASVYLPQSGESLPREQRTLGFVTQRGFARARGAVETMLESLKIGGPLGSHDAQVSLMEPGRVLQLELDGELLGYIGEISAAARGQFGLREPIAVGEVSVDLLERLARLVPQYVAPSPYPAMRRDLNLVADESVRWSDVERTVLSSAGEWLEAIEFQEVYRDKKKDGANKKRLLFSLTFRSNERTLTGEEVDAVRDRIVAQCAQDHGTVLLS